jgi:hypothetical protein
MRARRRKGLPLEFRQSKEHLVVGGRLTPDFARRLPLGGIAIFVFATKAVLLGHGFGLVDG